MTDNCDANNDTHEMCGSNVTLENKENRMENGRARKYARYFTKNLRR